MTQRFLLILLLLGIFRISSAQIGSLDIDDQTQNRALLQQKIYQLPDFDKIDFSEVQIIEENFQIPAYHIYNELWDTVHIRSKSIVIPFYQNTLKIRLVENNNNPFAFPCSGSLILDYGFLKKEFHSGIDFLETDGSPIVSCFDGVVRLARYYGDYGKVVVIRHYNGLETVYAHLKEISVVPGQIVKAGDLMVALPKPNRHADCINIILSLGLVPDIQNQWGKSAHQGFYCEQGKFYTRPQAALHAIECGQQEWTENDLELIALGEKKFSRMGLCSEDLW